MATPLKPARLTNYKPKNIWKCLVFYVNGKHAQLLQIQLSLICDLSNHFTAKFNRSSLWSPCHLGKDSWLILSVNQISDCFLGLPLNFLSKKIYMTTYFYNRKQADSKLTWNRLIPIDCLFFEYNHFKNIVYKPFTLILDIFLYFFFFLWDRKLVS